LPAALLLPGRQLEAGGNAGPRWMATAAFRAAQNPAYRMAVPLALSPFSNANGHGSTAAQLDVFPGAGSAQTSGVKWNPMTRPTIPATVAR
jgi:hypothetical protein